MKKMIFNCYGVFSTEHLGAADLVLRTSGFTPLNHTVYIVSKKIEFASNLTLKPLEMSSIRMKYFFA